MIDTSQQQQFLTIREIAKESETPIRIASSSASAR